MTPASRNRLNLALVVMVAALAALAYFKPGSKPATDGTPVISLAATRVNHIRIEVPDEPITDLARVGDNWQLTAPTKMPADNAAVEDMLLELGVKSQNHFSAAGADLKRYGLDPPKLKLWLNDTEYDFGDTEPVNQQRYMLAAGQIYLTSSFLFYRAVHGGYWWLDKHLLPAGARITALQLPDATLTQDAHGLWQLAPRNDRVTADGLQKLVDAWRDASAMSTDALGKDAPDGEVALTLTGQTAPLRFAILKDPNFLVLARPDLGLQYELDSSQRAQLLQLPETKLAVPAH